MSTGGRLARGFAQLSLVELVVRLLTFLGLIAIARLLGPVAFGQFAVAQAVLMYAGAVTDAGLKILAQREMVSDRSQAAGWATSALTVQFTAAAVVGGVVAVSSPLLPFDTETQRVLVVLTPVLLAQALNTQFVLQTYERFGALALSRLATQVAITGATLVLLVSGRSIVWVALAVWGGTLTGDAVALLLVRRLPDPTYGRITMAGVSRLLGQAGPFLGLNVLSLIAQNADVIVIGALLSAGEAGQYSVALRVVVILVAFSGVVVSVIMSEMVRLALQGTAALGEFLGRVLRPLCQFGFATAALLIVAADQLLALTFGSEFDDATMVLRVLAIVVPLGFCNSVLAQGLVASGAQRDYVAVAGVSAFFSVTSLVVLVPRAGINAAAGIMVCGEVITIIGLSVLFRRRWLATPAVELLRQVAWLAVPGAILILGRIVTDSAALSLALWAAALIGMDAVTGFSLAKVSFSLIRRPSRPAADRSEP